MKEEVALSPEGVPQVKALALPAMPCPTCDQGARSQLSGRHVKREEGHS
jgi:hypothetical protein